MKIIREHILRDPEVVSVLGGQNIWLVEKPEEVQAEHYIIFKYKPLNGGLVKDYLFEFNIVGKQISKLLILQDKLIQLLDDVRGDKIIKDNKSYVRHTKLLNGGGMVKNPDTGNYEVIVFFNVKI